MTWEYVLLWLLGDMGICVTMVTGGHGNVLLWLLGDREICVTMVTG